MVDKSDGITILPELAVMEFNSTQMKLVKRLKSPSPAREVSLVTHRDHVKTKPIQTLKEEILSIVPKQMQKLHNKKLPSCPSQMAANKYLGSSAVLLCCQAYLYSNK